MIVLQRSPGKIRVPKGFSFGAVAAGIKASGRPDLALVHIPNGAHASALFTKNLVVAAPVQLGRKNLIASRGQVRAVVVNSGNANCATGEQGIQACVKVCREIGNGLAVPANEVFPSSTGIIGVQLPVAKITARKTPLISSLSTTEQMVRQFAQAIMTTDTREKIASARFRSGSKSVTLLGIAKGAGMIHPQLATMLVYLFTDLKANPRELDTMLRNACDNSLNCISIDGDTSTNDTVLLLASGASGARLGPTLRARFSKALTFVCKSLAEQIISDGEGVEHVIRLIVDQARNRDEALQVARTIAHSMLVKTAWAGADPNWGRILAAIGRSGASIDPSRVHIFIGNQKVCSNGSATKFDEKQAHRVLAKPVSDIRVQLGHGKACIRFLTTDLTAEYVRINADYST